ncbi:MAG: hypothetical protein KAH84_03640 [Thiomargarita sp.]|nr:hypothetical protein [Thiomargarita sp.]
MKLTTEQLRKIELEERISRIEDAQTRTRVKIEQLNSAKVELSRLQVVAEKSISNKNNRLRGAQQVQAQELMKLNQQVTMREKQYQKLKQESDITRKDFNRDVKILKQERDDAIEKNKKLEKEKMELLRYGGSDNSLVKGLLMGLGLGILCIIAFVFIIFKTPLLDNTLCTFKVNQSLCTQMKETQKLERYNNQ